VCGLVKVVECEVLNAALEMLVYHPISRDKSTYFAQKLPQDNEEGHEIPRVAGVESLCLAPAHIFRGGAHRRRNYLARRVHEQLGEPFEDLLDDLRIRLLEVRDVELDSDVRYATCDFVVGL
jgi:hypothetical protein